MMKKLNTTRQLLGRDSGFTLVELMVVVGIIGILTAVAIPNFQSYQSKSRTSEAKIQLSSAYLALNSLLADYDTYATCLGEAGFQAGGRPYYAIGFGAEVTALNLVVRNNGGTCTDGVDYQFTASRGVGGQPAQVGDLTQSAATANTFTVKAAGRISASGGPNSQAIDKWAIDENKNVSNDAKGY